jgi:hypothetical protein
MDEAEPEKPNSSVDFAAVLDPWGFCTRIMIRRIFPDTLRFSFDGAIRWNNDCLQEKKWNTPRKNITSGRQIRGVNCRNDSSRK